MPVQQLEQGANLVESRPFRDDVTVSIPLDQAVRGQSGEVHVVNTKQFLVRAGDLPGTGQVSVEEFLVRVGDLPGDAGQFRDVLWVVVQQTDQQAASVSIRQRIKNVVDHVSPPCQWYRAAFY